MHYSMVFIMRAWVNPPKWLSKFIFKTRSPAVFSQALALGLLANILLFSASTSQAEFSVRYAETQLEDDVYLLDAIFSYELSEEVVKALKNGVALTLVLSIHLQRERWYMWDETIAILHQRYQLKHYALSSKYVLTYLNTGIQETYSSLEAVLLTLSKLDDFPLIDKHLIQPDNTYWVYLQIQLDIEALPAPLRPIAYFSSQWRLASDWYLCPLQPPPA